MCLVFALAFPTLVSATALGAETAVKLPTPKYQGTMSVEQAIIARKSTRSFKPVALTLAEISQVLWAADGKLPADALAGPTRKVVPSAGGLYPLEVFLLTGERTVENLPAGLYKYDSSKNSLALVAPGDKRTALAQGAYGQMGFARAPAILVIAAVFERTTMKYRDQGIGFVYMEAGYATQNVCLQAEAVGLHSWIIGAFVPSKVMADLQLPSGTAPLALVGIGK
jgi:SagB-type dehydrogenase family enzyme